MLFLLIDFPQILKLGKTHGILITIFHVSVFAPQLQRICSPLYKSKRAITPQQVIPLHTRISDFPD